MTLRDAGERRRARWNLPGERRTGKYNAFVWANTGTSTDQGDSLSIAGYRGNRSCVEGIFLNLTVEKRSFGRLWQIAGTEVIEAPALCTQAT